MRRFSIFTSIFMMLFSCAIVLASGQENLTQKQDIKISQRFPREFHARSTVLKEELGAYLKQIARSGKDNVYSKLKQLLDKNDFEPVKEYLTSLIDNKQDLKTANIASDKIFYCLGIIYFLKDDIVSAKTYYEKAVKLKPDNPSYLTATGNLHNLSGNHHKAQTVIGLAIDLLKLDVSPDPVLMANCYDELAFAFLELGDLKKAKSYYMESLRYARKMKENIRKQRLGRSYNNLGEVYLKSGEYKMAMDKFEASLKHDTAQYGKTSAQTAIDYNNIAMAYDAQGMYKMAIINYKKALEISEKLYPDKPDASVAVYNNNLGLAYCNSGFYEKGRDYFFKALEIDKKLFLEHTNKSFAVDYSNLSLAFSKIGDYEQALEYAKKALEIDLHHHPDGIHGDVLGDYSNLGAAYAALDMVDESVEAYTKSLDIAKKLYPEGGHIDVALCYNNLAGVFDGQGQFQNAADYYEKSLKILNKLFPKEDHPYFEVCYRNLANVYGALGNADKARKYLRMAFEAQLQQERRE